MFGGAQRKLQTLGKSGFIAGREYLAGSAGANRFWYSADVRAYYGDAARLRLEQDLPQTFGGAIGQWDTREAQHLRFPDMGQDLVGSCRATEGDW